MDAEAKEELYDILFNIAQQIMDDYNPCDWNNGKCSRMRSTKGEDKGCCEGCSHLGRKGCTVKALACKLWLCENQSGLFEECVAKLNVLGTVANYCGIPCSTRKSKEENFIFQPQR